MKVVLIADTFPPSRTSGAIQLRDLSREFARQGHNLTILSPSPNLKSKWSSEDLDGVRILRLKTLRLRDVSYLRRTLGELLMPFLMLRNLNKSPLCYERWDGVVWYSPSIFHGPLVNAIKRKSKCKGYLIIRDIFPEWAVDMGLMRRGLIYIFFDAVARYQYSLADVIGVQTSGNRKYFKKWIQSTGHKLEILPNWLGEPTYKKCSIRLNETKLAERKVFVYAGNMGVAQGMDILLDLAEKYLDRQDVGFLFVGRGSEFTRLTTSAKVRKLDNVLFYDEIHPDEISDLYRQCSVGLVSLDPNHKTHNIPGKFLTYMQNGLPVLASLNLGNDLSSLIRQEKVGQVCECNQPDKLFELSEEILLQVDRGTDELKSRCKSLFEREFNVKKAVLQILETFQN